MFTGIVNGQGVVAALDRLDGLIRLTLSLPEDLLCEVELGASISVDGVCLTVAKFTEREVTFDVMQETLTRTTLGRLEVGSRVNIERAARNGAEIGGHPVSGHIDCSAVITAIDRPPHNCVLTFEVPREWERYIFSKGYVAVNGASLTVTGVNKDQHSFQVWLIPETLRLTTFGEKQVGDAVNIEIDRNTQIVVDTVIDFLQDRWSDFLSGGGVQSLLTEPTRLLKHGSEDTE